MEAEEGLNESWAAMQCVQAFLICSLLLATTVLILCFYNIFKVSQLGTSVHETTKDCLLSERKRNNKSKRSYRKVKVSVLTSLYIINNSCNP